jgi:hypothetical protein
MCRGAERIVAFSQDRGLDEALRLHSVRRCAHDDQVDVIGFGECGQSLEVTSSGLEHVI